MSLVLLSQPPHLSPHCIYLEQSYFWEAIPGSDIDLGPLAAAAWSLAGPLQDLDAQVAWAPNTRSSSLPFRQECLLSEPEAREGCPPEAEEPLVGGEGNIGVFLASGLKGRKCLARSKGQSKVYQSQQQSVSSVSFIWMCKHSLGYSTSWSNDLEN